MLLSLLPLSFPELNSNSFPALANVFAFGFT